MPRLRAELPVRLTYERYIAAKSQPARTQCSCDSGCANASRLCNPHTRPVVIHVGPLPRHPFKINSDGDRRATPLLSQFPTRLPKTAYRIARYRASLQVRIFVIHHERSSFNLNEVSKVLCESSVPELRSRSLASPRQTRN